MTMSTKGQMRTKPEGEGDDETPDNQSPDEVTIHPVEPER